MAISPSKKTFHFIGEYNTETSETCKIDYSVQSIEKIYAVHVTKFK